MEIGPNKKTEIIFTNQPKLSGFEADKNFDERRIALVKEIEEFISNHPRFQGKKVTVEFSHKGVSSIVLTIEANGEKVVLKVPLSKDFAKGEALFLSTWENAGVKVPHVIENGNIGEYEYTLMEYVDAKPLSEVKGTSKLIRENTFAELGQTLQKMHIPKATGFGRVIDEKAEFESFKDWINSSDLKKRIDYVLENKILDGVNVSIPDAIKTLIDFFGDSNKSSFCHDDFGTSNIFDTNPPTVFDPTPRLNNGYMDLGKSIVLIMAHTKDETAVSQLISGYFGGAPYDRKALNASILINTCFKLNYWHRLNKFESIENIKEYLRRINS